MRKRWGHKKSSNADTTDAVVKTMVFVRGQEKPFNPPGWGYDPRYPVLCGLPECFSASAYSLKV
jgi:hypothetical protein